MKMFARLKANKLEKNIERYPQRSENYLKLAELYAEAEDWTGGVEVLERLLSQQLSNDEEIQVRLQLADFLANQGQSERAKEHVQFVLNREPKERQLLDARIAMVKLLFSPSDTPPADPAVRQLAQVHLEDLLRTLKSGDPLRSEMLRRLATVHAANGRRTDALTTLNDLARELERGGKERVKQLREVLREIATLIEQGEGDSASAKRIYIKLLELERDDDLAAGRLHYKLGKLCAQEDDQISAMEHYEMALRYLLGEDDIDMARAQLDLATLYLDTGREKQALQEVERAAKIKNLPSDLLYNIEIWIAEYHRREQAHAAAVAHAEKALANASAIPQRWRAHTLLFQCYLDQTNAELALRQANILEELADTGPEQGAAANAMALAHHALGRLDDALPCADRALSLLPENTDVSQLLLVKALAHRSKDEVVEALKTFLRICEEYRGSAAHSAAMKGLRELRQLLSDESARERYKFSAAGLVELDQLLDAAEGETDIVRRLRTGLAKTQANLVGNIERLLRGKSEIDAELLEELEEVLYLADLGNEATQSVISAIKERVQRKELNDPTRIKSLIKQKILELLLPYEGTLKPPDAGPFVVMMIGVNGTGKTTTIAKLAKMFTDQGKSVLLGAGDTFRAGAIEQLEEWGKRVGTEVIKHNPGSDPSGVAYDAVSAAAAREFDVLILDTAGRLHTKKNLMEELKKVHRVIGGRQQGAPHEVLLVVDATTGQNAMNQAKLFNEAAPITGLVLTKLDGTAKGGIIVRITSEFGIPVKFIGIGEKMDDLKPFSAEAFVQALFD